MAPFRAFTAACFALSTLVGVGVAHPGEEHSVEQMRKAIETRDFAATQAQEAVKKCAGTSKSKSMMARAAARRALTAQLLREEREIVHSMSHNVNSVDLLRASAYKLSESIQPRRDQAAADKWMKKCHDQSSHHPEFDESTPEAVIFTSNSTHFLTPESTVGPYYVTGEFIRSDVTEGQPGLPVHLDLQFIDINTCETIPNMLVDLWQANATGHYSGVYLDGGLNTTFLRGVQVTDHDGVVNFDTIYPGRKFPSNCRFFGARHGLLKPLIDYLGRANHIHVLTHRGGKILPNGTYSGGTVNHIGQLFLDQELTTLVELTEPYARNYLPLTSNKGDFLIADAASPDYDPFVNWIMLSDDANDGLLMYMTLAINASADLDTFAWPAAHYRKGGGVAEPFWFWPPANASGHAAGTGTAAAAATTSKISYVPPIPTDQVGWPSPSRAAPPAKMTPQPWGPCRTN
jgi:protocatechuate 3,4-dioxygenase beta subunit